MSEENITHPANMHKKLGESTNWYVATWHELAAACQCRIISSESIQGQLAQKRDILHTHAWLFLKPQLILKKTELNIGQMKTKYFRN